MQDSPFIHLRKPLQGTLLEPAWPAGIRAVLFDASRCQEVHALLLDAYRMGGGRVKALDDWWRDLLGDPEYSASTIFLAVDVHETIVGVAQCWTSAFLKDLVVSDAWRRKGVGEALLLEVFKAFQRRGSPYLDLKVEIRNPSGAERL